jgi:tetratricopeptide (TPR) repeat protein
MEAADSTTHDSRTPNQAKSVSWAPAAVGAVAGAALVALAAAGWWLAGRGGDSHPPASERLAAVTPASPPVAEASPHEGGTPNGVQDAETLRLRAELAARPDRVDVRRELALRLLRQGNFYGAFEEAGELLARAPDDVDGLFVVAAVRVRMGQPSRALPLLDEILTRSPDHLPALTAKGQALLKAGHDAAAMETWQRALELSGGSNRQVEELMREAGRESAPDSAARS